MSLALIPLDACSSADHRVLEYGLLGVRSTPLTLASSQIRGRPQHSTRLSHDSRVVSDPGVVSEG